MTDLVPVLRAELASLHSEVARIVDEVRRFQTKLKLATDRADKVSALLALYDDAEDKGASLDGLVLEEQRTPVSNNGSAADHDNLQSAAKRAFVLSKASQIKAAVQKLLLDRGTEHRNNILAALIEAGLMGTEKNPMGSLAAYLSDNKELFETDGRGNFKLRTNGESESNKKSLLITPLHELVSGTAKAPDTQ